ncbi:MULTISPECIES: DsbA family protein [Serratia]|uniref:Thiol:disulfide interchange protein n=1 Tax=Serratia marcescens TaxID=615 RepID=A0A5P6H093_SERMA|nr:MULTISPECIES: DsbA family protein [Serratia]AUY16451.1 thiol:disulfide interchange protein [Serratia sp. SSNIH1]EGT3595874.1 thioredoxin domain-containing protein [Serratia marcescens]EHT9936437.1 DsbA family protein [Serratia marcescens]EIJ6676259.1 DsbA family protein [Serratia marcescens]EMB4112608.1 DsbA family protein [Serratia marcescens]
MYKRPLLFISYTLVIIFASSFLTAFYFKHYVMQPPVAESLSFIAPEKIEQSPLQDDNTIVEVFSYACHYCEVNESGVAELEKSLPAGAKLVRLHLSDDSQAGMAAFAPLFATLTVMGIEAQHRPAAYRAIIKENLNLADDKQLSAWLTANGIDEAAYQQARESERVKELLAYMTAVSRYYQVNATPSFIVNRKWLALQDREFSAFSRQLLSLLQHDKPLAP